MAHCPECEYQAESLKNWFQKVGLTGIHQMVVCPNCGAILGSVRGV